MDHCIARICHELRVKLDDIDRIVADLSARIRDNIENAASEIGDHLGQLKTRIDLRRKQLLTDATLVNQRLLSDSIVKDASLALPDGEPHRQDLWYRAVLADRYARPALNVAMAAIDNAEYAAFEAFLAREKWEKTSTGAKTGANSKGGTDQSGSEAAGQQHR